MKQRLLIAFLTMVVLGAGYVAGVWTERRSCKVPSPPALLGELSTSKRPAHAKPAPKPAPNAAQLAAEIERLRPQIEEFRVRLNELDREMDRGIDEILTPSQRVKFAGIVKYYADLRAKEDAATSRGAPLTAEEITRLQQPEHAPVAAQPAAAERIGHRHRRMPHQQRRLHRQCQPLA